MKLVVSKNEFIKTLLIGGSFAGKNKIVKSLDCVKISVRGNDMHIVSTDGNNAIRKSMGIVESNGDISFVVSYKDVLNYVKLIKDDEVIISVNDNDVVVKHSKGKIKLPTYNADDFVSLIPDKEYTEADVPTYFVNNFFIDGVSFCDDNPLRPQLGTIYLYCKDNELGACATNGAVMFADSIPFDSSDFDCMIDRNVARTIVNAIKDTETVNLRVGERNVKFSGSDFSVLTTRMVGRFPNFKSVIPHDNHIEVKVNKEEFVGSIERCKLSSSASMLVKFIIDGMNMNISCQNVEMNTKSEENLLVEANSSLTIGFKADTFLNSISSAHTEDILLTFKNDKSACVIKEVDGDDKKVILQMPSIFY